MSAPLAYPFEGTKVVTFASRKHGAAPLPLRRPNSKWKEYAVHIGWVQQASRQAASVVTRCTVPGADIGPTRVPLRSIPGNERKVVELQLDAEACNYDW